MAVVHQTTMVPSKLELLTRWLPKQDWYTGGPEGPSLAKVGGFRLDDPAGAVGIEFMIVDGAGRCPDPQRLRLGATVGKLMTMTSQATVMMPR